MGGLESTTEEESHSVRCSFFDLLLSVIFADYVGSQTGLCVGQKMSAQFDPIFSRTRNHIRIYNDTLNR